MARARCPFRGLLDLEVRERERERGSTGIKGVQVIAVSSRCFYENEGAREGATSARVDCEAGIFSLFFLIRMDRAGLRVMFILSND